MGEAMRLFAASRADGLSDYGRRALAKKARAICAATNRAGVLTACEPPTWTDLVGTVRKTPTTIGRLKSAKIPLHRALRDHVLARDGACSWCGTTDDLVPDHIISRRNGGSHHPDNLQALCQPCNSSKVGNVDARAE